MAKKKTKVKKPVVTPNVGGSCDTGYHWDSVLKRCVLDAG